MHAVGVDVGGTFTDLAAVAPDGRVSTAKVLTRPADQSEGVLDALGASGLAPAAVGRVVHGTTVVTNLLLERTGARVVLCATAGHTDVLRLRRQDRARLYDLAAHHPAPLVAPDDAVAVRERMGPEGVVHALDTEAVADAVAAVRARAPEAVAIVLLHAYAHDAHERALADALAAALPDGIPVVRSSAVYPEPREYERAATTTAEAYARPRVAHYLRRLGARLGGAGYPAAGVMTSGGGVLRSGEAAESAAALALSGPAGGVAGAAAVLAALGIRDALTLDVGGTSADVGLVLDGEPLVEAGGAVAGVPIALPRVLVDTVSAGGGSVAWVDDGGALRVGPRSAGVAPGPAAFGRGGTEATVTDAHVVLGHLAPARLSGDVAIDPARAWAAVGAVAERLDGRGGDAERVRAVARGIVAAADAEMARALRRVSVERGVDPRGLVLVAFGGGGPLHACGLAERLGVTRVVVPPHAGVLSAVGLAAAPDRREALVGVARAADALPADVLGALVAQGAARTGAGAERRTWARVRYAGQGAELDVPVHDGDDGRAVAERFAAAHARRAGFTLERPAEVVSLRHAAVTPGTAPVFARTAGAPVPSLGDSPGPARVDDAAVRTGDVVRGPAAIALADATAFVPAGWSARALPTGGWLVEAG
ncbi:hydantoinase [Gemmatimonadetes bacterium T265]|nr:hydantoinase [Gemmatimonadetes bacterium T265]